MKQTTNQTQYLSVSELFSSDNYVIPIYQRDYAWTNSQIVQLIQDIADSQKRYGNTNKKYYIGTLIAYEQKENNESVYQIIDGQQRITTLTLLLDYLKNDSKFEDIELPTMDWYNSQKLHFDCRQTSTQTLDLLFDGQAAELSDIDSNVTIKQGYEDIQKCFFRICNETGIKVKDFCEYLFNNVYILRVLVPEDTDLNHYFEIMNSRGEQLEKHEILKAKCLSILDTDERYAFALIWDACSNMERYVQYGFSTEQRTNLFGPEWNKIPIFNNDPESINEFYSKLKCPDDKNESVQNNADKKETVADSEEKEKDNKNTLNGIIDDSSNSIKPNSENPDSKDSLRFNSIINFSNFLLHILKIQVKKDIALDDKRLIDAFTEQLDSLKDDTNKQKAFVKEFGYNLLKGKMLYDRYVIKREFVSGKDNWSLKCLVHKDGKQTYTPSFKKNYDIDNSEDENQTREIIMLLAMFHVSTPTLVYKHWLNAVLFWLFKNSTPSFEQYKEYLENLAHSFFFDRYLAKEPLDYYKIIYENESKPQNMCNEKIDKEKLNKGVDVENFIFNYLDYLLWQDYISGNKHYFPPFFKDDSRVSTFEFTFRSSVEHYYPQHPIEDNSGIEGKWLNNFGNLCLISSQKNSRLSNYMPTAKKEHYENSPTIDSIKQCIMMSYDEWDTIGVNEIENHYIQMCKCLFDCLESEAK